MLEFFNKFVNIQSVGVSTGTTGNTYGTTTLYSNLPVMIQPNSAAPYLAQDARKVLVTHKVYCNQNITVSPGNQVVYGSRIFKIIFVRNLCEANTMWVLDCQERIDESL